IPICTAAGLMVVAQAGVFRFLPSERNAVPDFSKLLAGGVGFVLALLLFMAVRFFGYIAVSVAVYQAVSGRTISIGDAWRFPTRLPVFGTLLLASLATFGGLMCCIVPGIYLGLLFSMALPVMI